MPNRLTGSLALLFALAILTAPTATRALAMDRIALPDNDPYAALASVQKMHQAQNTGSGPFITVFEVGGGDPAMNGSFIYLRIEHNERSYVWKTGLNVRAVKRISLNPGNAVLLRTEEDFMDSKSAIASRPAAYRIIFHLNNGELQNTVTVEKNVKGKK